MANENQLHRDILVIDGLIIADWGPEVFKAMNRGGLTAANCTCSVWEGFHDTMLNIAAIKELISGHRDKVCQVYETEDIIQAKEKGKTGIILGFQNTSAFEDRLEHIRLFKDLGVGIAQLTYNTQNLAGSGCYESRDSGLSDFGRELILEMNRLGMAVDLSHVGPLTSREVIEHSKAPVCFSHCLPMGLKEHPRNKSDELLRKIADHGGLIGVTMFSPFLPKGNDSDVSDYVAAIEYMINLVGEDCIAIGTDFTQGHGPEFISWLCRDKGRYRELAAMGEIINPRGMREISDFPHLTEAMLEAGWSEARIAKVMGGNWLNYLKEVWGK